MTNFHPNNACVLSKIIDVTISECCGIFAVNDTKSGKWASERKRENDSRVENQLPLETSFMGNFTTIFIAQNFTLVN